MNRGKWIRWVAFLALTVAGLGLPAARAAALVEPYNPALLITDEEFNDPYAMSCEQIQAFLNERSGILKNYVDDGKTAAQHICEQANRFGLNPRLLLTMIQKEQGLLTTPNPSEWAINWAAGCGPGWASTKGFAVQIECAARTLRRRFDAASLGQTIDGVTPLNRATLALYRYTTHVAGNRDFWRIWTRYWPASAPLADARPAGASSPLPAEIVVDSRLVEATPRLVNDCRRGWVVGTRGGDGHYFVTPNVATAAESTNTVIWRPNLPRAGVYQVFAFIPNRAALPWTCGGGNPVWDTGNARYTIKHRDGETTYSVNQAPLHDVWVNLGAYYFNAGADSYVRLTDVTGEPSMSRYVSFDNVKFVFVGE
ncbi:MAG: hypothetical protein RMN25_08630 [Anaerolineae bacterium]|nr:hypothetical protein [Thermoflexales bacterium]MDW8407838.1 hypothetical protein [Anaerolineae bacterium]